MGVRGPAAKPAELRVLEGNRGHRPLNLDQLFRPEVGAPEAPRWLNREARKAWRRLLPELLRYNLLSRVDRDSFAMLCQTIGRCEQLERAIGAEQERLIAAGQQPADALMQTTPGGMQVHAAVYQILNREQAKLHQLLAGFGLRPDARARVTAAVRAQLNLFDVNATPDPAAQPRGFAEFE